MKVRHLVFAASTAMFSFGALAGGEPRAQDQSGDGAEAQAIRDATTVRVAQQRLRAAGYAATPDGLKEFQQAKGIAPSGKLDQQTLAALGVGASAASGASGESAPQRGERPKY